MTKFEYKITQIEANVHGHVILDEAYLNELGQQGWELVGWTGTHSVLRRVIEEKKLVTKIEPQPGKESISLRPDILVGPEPLSDFPVAKTLPKVAPDAKSK